MGSQYRSDSPKTDGPMKRGRPTRQQAAKREASDAGFRAAQRGESVNRCNYKDRDLAFEWQKGWYKGWIARKGGSRGL